MVPSCSFSYGRSGNRVKSFQETHEGIQLDRLDQMVDEAGIPAALAELGMSPPGQSDERNVRGVGEVTDVLGHFLPVHPRHPQVQ
jgi:hypothetical protein